MNESKMHEYSEPAWRIASLYSSVLASETRDLAAHIDEAIAAALRSSAPQADVRAALELRFKYSNYRGQVADRHVRPISIRYGTSEYHKKIGWLMLAFDLDKGADREFAMDDIFYVEPSTSIVFAASPPSAALDGRDDPGEKHPILKHADELHELGFNAGWNGAVEECAKVAERSLIGHTLTPGGLARQDEAEGIAENIRAFTRPQPGGAVAGTTKIIDRIDCAATRGARRQAMKDHKSMMPQVRSTVHEYVASYEFRFDGGGGHTPSDDEKAMLEDAIEGYFASGGAVAGNEGGEAK